MSKCNQPNCDYPAGQCAELCTIMNPAGRRNYREIEILVLDHLKETGHVLSKPCDSTRQDKVHLGNMVIELILLAENMGLDLTDCLQTAYESRTGDRK